MSLEQYVRGNSDGAAQKKAKGEVKKSENIAGNSLVRYLKDTVGAPDTGMLWLPFALLCSIRIFNETPFDAIFATGPPFSTFLIGLAIKTLTNRPLIVDFRDAWVANPNLTDESEIKLYFHRLYEKLVVRYARYVIANTDGVQKDFITRYPTEDRSKFVVISNGFDKRDLIISKRSKLCLDKTKFNIVHTGSLGGIRNPRYFFAAIKELIDENKIDPNLINIHLVGIIEEFNDGCAIGDYMNKYQIAEQIKMTGFISREDAFAYTFEADVLLLVIGITSEKYLLTYGLSGKIYDYVLTGRPIIALAQEGGATFELLKKHNIAIIANPSNIHDIKGKILKLYNLWKERELQSNYEPASLKSHDMRNLTRILSNLLMPRD